MDETIAHILQERRLKVQRNINQATRILEKVAEDQPLLTHVWFAVFEYLSEATRELDTLR